ncbi:MAG: pyridoxamine 5'-phosphate oxidase family protein [Hydrogenovibrio sp.]|nr:pyridoxamine 5'-phosphate oxidase family protein [Hydrogenovibrio sp.]
MTDSSSDNHKPLASIHQECMAFIDRHQTVILATVSPSKEPESSYAPVMKIDNRFYVYLSELAAHTQNLMETPKASLLFIESEENTENLFARKRVSIKATATEIRRQSEAWQTIMDRFEQKFGDIIQMLKPLEDFHLFELAPSSGNYVRGFAQAYQLTGEDFSDVRHRNERGHGQSQTD